MVFGTLAWDTHGTRHELSLRSEEESSTSEGFMPKLMKTLFTWHGGAYTNTFNSEPSCGGLFSDCAMTAGEDGQMTSQGIEIPSWTLVQQSDAGGIPVESFERTIEVPFGTIVQKKKVSHPDPANQVGDAWVGGKPTFKMQVISELTPNSDSKYTDKQSTTIQDDAIDDPFNPSTTGKWELSGLDDWFTTEKEEEAEEESDDTDDTEEQPSDLTGKVPAADNSKVGLYILGGIGVLAAGYLYFIIRNPQAYVQATAIRTGGNLLGQALS
tara:strand:+ start:5906 stop:6712 length:807 start_codon:yes stop_codon:yes gene_type:complete